MTYKKEDVLREVKLSEVAYLLGINLQKAGKGFKAHCPLPGHKDNSPSFILYDNEKSKSKKGFWECKVCGIYGDMFELVMQVKNMTFDEAVNFIGSNFPDVPEVELSPGEARKIALRKQAEPVLEDICTYFQTNISPDVYAYLNQERNLTRETIEKFEIGYAPKDVKSLKVHLFNLGHSQEDLLVSGVFDEKKGFVFPVIRDRVVFPLRDNKGRLVGFNSRSLPENGEETKYILSFASYFSGKEGFLYGLHHSRGRNANNSREILIVEGVVDVQKVFQETDYMAVSVLGSTVQTQTVSKINKYLDVDNIYLALDGDESGETGTKRFVENFNKESLRAKTVNIAAFDANISVVPVPSGEDIDSFLDQGGDLLSLVQRSTPFVDYVISSLAKEYDLSHPQDKDNFIKRVLIILSYINAFSEEVYLSNVEKMTSVSMEHLKEKLKIMKVDSSSSMIEALEADVLYYVIEENVQLPPGAEKALSLYGQKIVNKDYSAFPSLVRYLSALDRKPAHNFENSLKLLQLFKLKKLISSFEGLNRERRKYLAKGYTDKIQNMYRQYKRLKQELI